MSEKLVINSFKYGLDSRRDQLVSQPGTLAAVTNMHVNDGGELEKRMSFVDHVGSVGGSAAFIGTYGVLSATYPIGTPVQALVVFCDYSAAAVNSTFWGSVFYPQQVTTNSAKIAWSLFRCRHPKGAFGGADDILMTGIQWAVLFNGYPLVCAKFSDNNCFLYYGGSTTPYHPIDASAMGLVIATLTHGYDLAGQLVGFVNGRNGPGLSGWLASFPIASATLNAGGSGYRVNEIYSINGGTIRKGGAAATIKVITPNPGPGALLTFSLITTGAYTVAPTSPAGLTFVSGTGPGGSSGTLNLTMANWADIFSPVGIIPTYSTLTTTDPTGTISEQHVQDARTGSPGASGIATLHITGVGATGDVWTAGVETAPGAGTYVTVGTYVQVAGDTTVTIAAGIANAINTTTSSKNVTATSDSSSNVACSTAPGDTSVNGSPNSNFQITTTGAGTIGAGTTTTAVLNTNSATGTVIGLPGRTYTVTSNQVSVTANNSPSAYTWTFVSGDSTVLPVPSNASSTVFRATGIAVNGTKSAVYNCVVTGTPNITTSNVNVVLSVESNQ